MFMHCQAIIWVPLHCTTHAWQHNDLKTMCLLQPRFSKRFNSETFFAPPNTKSTTNSFHSVDFFWTFTTISHGSMPYTASAGLSVFLELHHVNSRSPHVRRQPDAFSMCSVLYRCCDVNVQSKSQITRSCADNCRRSTPLLASIFCARMPMLHSNKWHPAPLLL